MPCTSAKNPSASMEKPNSLGSWPTMIVMASPFMYPTCTSLGEQVGDEAELAQAEADLDEPDHQREHPGQRDGARRVAAGDSGSDRREDQRGDRGVRAEHEDA